MVGDVDTAPWPGQDEDEIGVLAHVKDDTETEYGAKVASEKGFDEALVLGALGGSPAAHSCGSPRRRR